MTDLTKPVTRRVTTARIRDFKLPALIITIATGTTTVRSRITLPEQPQKSIGDWLHSLLT